MIRTSIFLLSAVLLLTACHTTPPTRISYKEILTATLPATAGKYVITTSPQDLEGLTIQKEAGSVPWPFYQAFDDGGDAKVYKDQLRVKGKWYCLRWSGATLRLNLKKNKEAARDALVLFWKEGMKESFGFKLRQQGE